MAERSPTCGVIHPFPVITRAGCDRVAVSEVRARYQAPAEHAAAPVRWRPTPIERSAIHLANAVRRIIGGGRP